MAVGDLPLQSAARAAEVDWAALQRHLTWTARRRGFRAIAEDLASEAVVRTIVALGPTPTRSHAAVWCFALTTCNRLIVDTLRNRDTAGDGTAARSDAFDEIEGRVDPAAATNDDSRGYFLRTLHAVCRGTQRRILHLLQDRSITNAEMATELGLSRRAIELARHAIRAKAERIFADSFGRARPFSWRHWCRPAGQT